MALLEKETNHYYRIDFDRCAVRGGLKVFVDFSVYKNTEERKKEKQRTEKWAEFFRKLRETLHNQYTALLSSVEAAGYQSHEIQDLGEAIKDLLAQERELIALKAKGYIRREDYEEQHAELLQQIHETEAKFVLQTRRSGERQQHADEYSDRLAAALEVAEIDDFTITFKFKNGAEVKRVFNSDTDRKETGARKKEVAIYG